MHIITQNLRHGWGDRFKQLIHTCLKEDPDVIVLTERRNNKQKLYESINIEYNQYIIQDISPKQNSVCILTKEKATIKHIYQHHILVLQYYWLSIWWVYFPQKNAKKKVFEFIETNLSITNSVVIWDFNTWKHFIDEKWKTFSCQNEFTKLSEENLCDARRRRNKVALEYSRYSNAWNWFRLDHILVTHDINKDTIDIWYDHSIREIWLSDHSMMYMKF